MQEELRYAALTVWRGFRQGSFQGTKIRLPHAFVLAAINNRPDVWTSKTTREFLDRIAGCVHAVPRRAYATTAD